MLMRVLTLHACTMISYSNLLTELSKWIVEKLSRTTRAMPSHCRRSLTIVLLWPGNSDLRSGTPQQLQNTPYWDFRRKQPFILAADIFNRFLTKPAKRLNPERGWRSLHSYDNWMDLGVKFPVKLDTGSAKTFAPMQFCIAVSTLAKYFQPGSLVS